MTQRDRIMLGAVALVAVLAATWMLALKPKRDEAAQLAEQAQQAQQRRDTALASLATAQQARADFAGAQIGIARMGKAVPTDDDVASVVYQLGVTARKAGIDFRALTLDASGTDPTPATGPGSAKPGATTSVTKIPFQLRFDGSFLNLRRFVALVNSFTRTTAGHHLSVRGRLLSVEGVGMQAGPKGFPAITAHISAVAYSAPAPSATNAASTSTAPTGTGSTTPASTSSTGEAAR